MWVCLAFFCMDYIIQFALSFYLVLPLSPHYYLLFLLRIPSLFFLLTLIRFSLVSNLMINLYNLSFNLRFFMYAHNLYVWWCYAHTFYLIQPQKQTPQTQYIVIKSHPAAKFSSISSLPKFRLQIFWWNGYGIIELRHFFFLIQFHLDYHWWIFIKYHLAKWLT